MTRGQITILGLLTVLGLAGLSLGGWLVLQGTGQSENSTPTPTPAAAPTASAMPTLAPQVPPTAEMIPSPTVAHRPADCIPASSAQAGANAKVLAGGLIEAEVEGKTLQIRLIGVDPAGSGGQELALLRELVEGKVLHLAGDGETDDGQGHLRRYVLAGETFVNYELVRRGAALPALFPPGMACTETLLAAEGLARAEGLGYWALQAGQPTAVLPAATLAARPCDCSVKYQCSDFRTRAAAQACYNACGDYRNTSLDPDHNGLACEQLP